MNANILRILLVLGLAIGALPILSAGAYSIDDPAFQRTWARTDKPVADGVVNRTWMWGPSGHTQAFMEPYVDAPGGQRLVQYMDKSRMEDNTYRASAPWDVTNGLLAQELITGERQVGDTTFEPHQPANVQIAGDPNPDTPTYASFSQVLAYEPIPTGWTLIQTIDKAGTVSTNDDLAQYGATAEYHVSETNHTVASPFWAFMNSSGQVYEDGQFVQANLFENPFFATGFPITEAYWMHVPVAGEWQWVLAQCFERRCLTYTPGNPDGWQVEAGNIGQHYYEWRYGVHDLGTLNVYYFDVGQADSTLLTGPNCNILIDAGHWQRNDVVPHLQSVGITELDLMILTHPHADHIGQVPNVTQAYSVSEVWMSGWEHTSQTFENAVDAILDSGAAYHEPRAGEAFTCGSKLVEVVNPVDPPTDVHDNLAVRITFGNVRFLFTGNAEAQHESEMIDRAEPLQAQVLQLGHHGSSTSTSASFLDVVNPEVAIYSAGVDSQFGHPHNDVVTRVLDRGIDLYGTAVHGTIRVETNGHNYTVYTDDEGEISPPPACIDLNSASHEALQEIIHIGPARATDIINGRPWYSVDDLMSISGIGPSTLQDIKDQGLACV